MKQFFIKNIDVLLVFMTLFFCANILSAQKSALKLPFEEIDFIIGRKNSNKLIDTYEEAVKIGLVTKNIESEKFYKNNAVYLFNVGGGCFGAKPHEISTELENNIVLINWAAPNEPCPEVGIAMSFYGQIIISKKEYPNYKSLRFKYCWE